MEPPLKIFFLLKVGRTTAVFSAEFEYVIYFASCLSINNEKPSTKSAFKRILYDFTLFFRSCGPCWKAMHEFLRVEFGIKRCGISRAFRCLIQIFGIAMQKRTLAEKSTKSPL
jgi:hypothetical protein